MCIASDRKSGVSNSDTVQYAADYKILSVFATSNNMLVVLATLLLSVPPIWGGEIGTYMQTYNTKMN